MNPKYQNLPELEKAIRTLPPKDDLLDTRLVDHLIYLLEEVDSLQIALEYFYAKSLHEPISASTMAKYLETLFRQGKLVKFGKTSYGDDIYYSLESLFNDFNPDLVEQGTLRQITRSNRGWMIFPKNSPRESVFYEDWGLDLEIYAFDACFVGEVYCCEKFLQNFCETSEKINTVVEISNEILTSPGKVYRVADFLVLVPVSK